MPRISIAARIIIRAALTTLLLALVMWYGVRLQEAYPVHMNAIRFALLVAILFGVILNQLQWRSIRHDLNVHHGELIAVLTGEHGEIIAFLRREAERRQRELDELNQHTEDVAARLAEETAKRHEKLNERLDEAIERNQQRSRDGKP